jgi:diaminohydroxyphosphoribosylaminopyrimidine deaminase/5-amino-6-(5-phosphoribosylamino)uracil reductase
MAIGAEGTPSLAAMGIARLADAPRFALDQVTPVGGDIMQRWVRSQSL